MDLFTEVQRQQLLTNGHPDNLDKDHLPVVKLFLPFTGCCWLLSELDLEDPDTAFGLCDLGMGFPELGSVSISELQSLLLVDSISVERDQHFTAAFPMSVYAEAARAEQGITSDPWALHRAQAALQKAQRFKPPALRP